MRIMRCGGYGGSRTIPTPASACCARGCGRFRRGLKICRRPRSHRDPSALPEDTIDDSFIEWADSASGEKVIRAIQVLSGARLVPGRRRPNEKRSHRHVEPVILGQAHGAVDIKPKGGRPVAEPRQMLITNLAFDWLGATGSMPQPGRSDHTGFGQLAYFVFDWLHEPGAERAMRDYWRRVDQGRRQNIRDTAEPAKP